MSDEPIFDDETPVFDDELDDEPEAWEPPDGPDWTSNLERFSKGARKGMVKDSYENTDLVMRNDPILAHLGMNTLGGRLSWRVLPPWRKEAEENLPYVNDADLARVESIIRSYFGGLHSSLASSSCQNAILIHSSNNSFNPWRDHIESLPAWDGVPRVPEAIPTVKHTDYSRQVFLNWFLGMMQRVYEPGCQMDSMLVLWGDQGARKTSWIKALVPIPAMVAELHAVPDTDRNKDAMAKVHNAAIGLFDELDNLNRKTDQSALKAFITGREDEWRSPFGKVSQSWPRGFVLAGTTNEAAFLVDGTGSRRYWPIEVRSRIPEEYLTREYGDLLLAEARDRYQAGERLVYGDEFEALAEEAREGNTYDSVGEAIESWLAEPGERDSRTEIRPGVIGTPATKLLNTRRVSVAMLLDNVPDFAAFNAVKDKHQVDKITAYMDRHPDYRRWEGKRQRVYGRVTRRFWEWTADRPVVAESMEELEAEIRAEGGNPGGLYVETGITYAGTDRAS